MKAEKLKSEWSKYIPSQGTTDKLILFLSYLGLKDQIGDGTVMDYFLEIKFDPDLWRGFAAEILSIPFDLAELEERDVIILRQFETFLTV